MFPGCTADFSDYWASCIKVYFFITAAQNTEPKVMLGASDVSKTILINSGTD